MDNATEIRERIALTLREFSAEHETLLEAAKGHSVGPSLEEFPIPELALYVLRDLMGFQASGTSEKVRWTVYCGYRGYPCSFSLRKFGFHTFVGGDEQNLRRALGALRKAMLLAEPLLHDFAKDQAELGNVTLSNEFNGFDARYRYFRDKSMAVYGKMGERTQKPPDELAADKVNDLLTSINNALLDATNNSNMAFEGYWLTTAMVDAFYSRLEHIFVLLLAFTPFEPSNGNLVRVIRSDWDEKLKTVFDIANDKDAKILYDELKSLKERTRNPEAHGGFEKGWHSLFFHLPKIGALPGNLMRFNHSRASKFIPATSESDFGEICSIFDRVDDLIRQRFPYAFRYVSETVLSISFDRASRADYNNAIGSAEAFDNFMIAKIHIAEMHANMDY